jgi:hypothetical protein
VQEAGEEEEGETEGQEETGAEEEEGGEEACRSGKRYRALHGQGVQNPISVVFLPATLSASSLLPFTVLSS